MHGTYEWGQVSMCYKKQWIKSENQISYAATNVSRFEDLASIEIGRRNKVDVCWAQIAIAFGCPHELAFASRGLYIWEQSGVATAKFAFHEMQFCAAANFSIIKIRCTYSVQ